MARRLNARTAAIAPPAQVAALDRARVRTLADLYAQRLLLTPQAEACRCIEAQAPGWRSLSWAELGSLAQRYAAGLRGAGLKAGDRVALQVPNGADWLALDWAGHSLGLVTVGLFADETPAGTVQLLDDSGARLLVTRDLATWNAGVSTVRLDALDMVVPLRGGMQAADTRVQPLGRFLDADRDGLGDGPSAAGDLASIVYTSGSTGRPRGVMQSHEALLANAFAVQDAMPLRPDDLLFSTLPLAHLFGRVAWVYAGIVSGASLVFGRGAGFLAEDLCSQRPTVLIGPPRLFERIHGALSHEMDSGPVTRRALFHLAVEAGWAARRTDAGKPKVRLLPTLLARRAGESLRARLGGNLRLAVCGGAALAPQIGRSFSALGIPLLQGYGLTEAGPVVSVNRVEDNEPGSVGRALSGVETRIEASGELCVRGPSTMLGYWNDADGTHEVLDDAGWLRTGDKASRLDTDRIYLVGRVKELLVTATGEKVSPSDIESRLRALALVEQVMVVGEARPFLTALLVPQVGPLALLRAELGLIDGDDSDTARDAIEHALLQRCQEVLRDAPRNHWILRVALVLQPWTAGNGRLTSTHKLRRGEIARAHGEDIERLYRGHYHVPPTDCSSNAQVQGS